MTKAWWIAVLSASVIVLAIVKARAHDIWINQGALKNPAGEWCCGDYDCKELNYTPKSVAGGYQLDNGEIIPQSEIMPVSPGGWWICRRPDGSRRCTFMPPSGS